MTLNTDKNNNISFKGLSQPQAITLNCKSIIICGVFIFVIFEVSKKPQKATPTKNSPQISLCTSTSFPIN